ncbi:hypothetical protein IFM89_035990 [Coptis chinensis]|uniref:DUF3444 domain-containing protein n=1 Tax=Coptis chinensis TaxID=261450 RepID=A0A835ITB5_9MAGN|nr:hypothetical protein IFM89_035990 [Coptis chinensis]
MRTNNKKKHSPAKTKVSNKQLKEKLGRLTHFRVPKSYASIVTNLCKQLDHTSEAETFEWLLKQAEPSVRAVLGKTYYQQEQEEKREGPIIINNHKKTDVVAYYDSHRLQSYNHYELGSVWALSDEVDGMPRLYGKICRLFPEELEIEVALLEPQPVEHYEKKWGVDNNLPMVCGTFKEVEEKMVVEITDFSHRVMCENVRGSFYHIFPKKGEVWAVYKKWDVNWTLHDLNSHIEYEIVEVVSDLSTCIIGVRLVRVEGFEALFKRQMRRGLEKTQQFSRKELLRFSHRVPASKLDGEVMDGFPSGSWMLKSSAIPPMLL